MQLSLRQLRQEHSELSVSGPVPAIKSVPGAVKDVRDLSTMVRERVIEIRNSILNRVNFKLYVFISQIWAFHTLNNEEPINNYNFTYQHVSRLASHS